MLKLTISSPMDIQDKVAKITAYFNDRDAKLISYFSDLLARNQLSVVSILIRMLLRLSSLRKDSILRGAERVLEGVEGGKTAASSGRPEISQQLRRTADCARLIDVFQDSLIY